MTNELLFLLSIVFYFGAVLLAYKFFGKNGLFVWSAVSVVLTNLEVIKMVDMFGLSLTLGNALYASNFVVTDILSENHSKEDSNKAVNIGLFTTIIWIVFTQLILWFIPSDLDFVNSSFETIFGLMPRIAFASIFTYAVAQKIDIVIYHKIWSMTDKYFGNKEKGLWIRNNLSTITSQFIDTVIFTIVAFVGTMPISELIILIITTFVLKFMVCLLDTPVIYIAKHINRKREG